MSKGYYTPDDALSLKKKPTISSEEMDKRKRKVLDTIFKYFNDRRSKKPQTEFVVVLISKFKFQSVMAIFYGFVMIFSIFALGMAIQFDIKRDEEIVFFRFLGFEVRNFGMRVITVIMIIVSIGIGVRLLVFGTHLRQYFIVFSARGIYYKKIGKPRFISWTDVVRIENHYRGSGEEIIKLYLKSKKKVRFNSNNYLCVHKIFSVADMFRLIKFRRTPFF